MDLSNARWGGAMIRNNSPVVEFELKCLTEPQYKNILKGHFYGFWGDSPIMFVSAGPTSSQLFSSKITIWHENRHDAERAEAIC